MGQTRSVRFRYTLPALADLSAILDYIAAHSPQSAQRVQARIQALTDLLLLHPHIGRRTNDPAIRRMTTTPYPSISFSTRPRRPRSSFTPSVTPPAISPECPAPLERIMAEPFYGSTPIGGIARRLLRISMLFLNLFILRSKKRQSKFRRCRAAKAARFCNSRLQQGDFSFACRNQAAETKEIEHDQETSDH